MDGQISINFYYGIETLDPLFELEEKLRAIR